MNIDRSRLIKVAVVYYLNKEIKTVLIQVSKAIHNFRAFIYNWGASNLSMIGHM